MLKARSKAPWIPRAISAARQLFHITQRTGRADDHDAGLDAAIELEQSFSRAWADGTDAFIDGKQRTVRCTADHRTVLHEKIIRDQVQRMTLMRTDIRIRMHLIIGADDKPAKRPVTITNEESPRPG